MTLGAATETATAVAPDQPSLCSLVAELLLVKRLLRLQESGYVVSQHSHQDNHQHQGKDDPVPDGWVENEVVPSHGYRPSYAVVRGSSPVALVRGVHSVQQLVQ